MFIEIQFCQVKGEWQTKDEKLRSYQEYLSKLASEFDKINFTHMSKDKNRFIDALTTLASMKWIDIRGIIQKINIKVRSFQAHYNSLKETIDGKSWYSDNKRFI